jgi:hypothetical protein
MKCVLRQHFWGFTINDLKYSSKLADLQAAWHLNHFFSLLRPGRWFLKKRKEKNL